MILVDFSGFFGVISKTYICQSLSFLYIIACRYLFKMNITDNFSLCKTRNRHVTRKICFGRVKRIGDWFISTLTKTFYIKLTLLFGSNYKWIAIFGDCGCHTLMLKLWKYTFLACNETRFWYWNKHDVLYIKEYTNIEEN